MIKAFTWYDQMSVWFTQLSIWRKQNRCHHDYRIRFSQEWGYYRECLKCQREITLFDE